MNQLDAKELVQRLLLCAQKARSDIAEALDDRAGQQVAQMLMPHLMDERRGTNTVRAFLTYANKERLEPIDVYNALYLARLEAPVGLLYGLWYHTELPDPKLAMMDLMAEDRSK